MRTHSVSLPLSIRTVRQPARRPASTSSRMSPTSHDGARSSPWSLAARQDHPGPGLAAVAGDAYRGDAPRGVVRAVVEAGERARRAAEQLAQPAARRPPGPTRGRARGPRPTGSTRRSAGSRPRSSGEPLGRPRRQPDQVGVDVVGHVLDQGAVLVEEDGAVGRVIAARPPRRIGAAGTVRAPAVGRRSGPAGRRPGRRRPTSS